MLRFRLRELLFNLFLYQVMPDCLLWGYYFHQRDHILLCQIMKHFLHSMSDYQSFFFYVIDILL